MCVMQQSSDHGDQSSMLLGLVGEGITASLTPAMQEREGQEHGIAVTYRLLDAEALGIERSGLPDLVARLVDEGYDGFNVTHPFKQAVVPLLDEVSEHATDLGAVNTVVVSDGALLGRNTDWSGYAQAFSDAMGDAMPAVTAAPALVVGGGGAGVAVGYALLHLGVPHVRVAELDHDRAEDWALRLGKRFGDTRVSIARDVPSALAESGGVVNATPVGMRGHPGTPIPVELLRPDLWVSDVVYFPLETELVRTARARGCTVVAGGGMAVHQAVEAFSLFTGRQADAVRMQRHFAELTI
jgi:shikimate dehydrogenase